jgi:hypothetical protein
MKKKIWFAFSIIGIVVLLSVSIIIKANKPNLIGYSTWLENKYHVQCLDYANGCEAFTLKVKENGQEVTITMHNMHGGYDPGIFAMSREAHYRSFDNLPYALDIDVKGFNGSFKIEKVKSTLPNKRI